MEEENKGMTPEEFMKEIFKKEEVKSVWNKLEPDLFYNEENDTLSAKGVVLQENFLGTGAEGNIESDFDDDEKISGEEFMKEIFAGEKKEDDFDEMDNKD